MENNDADHPSKKPKLFCVRTFRKELKESEALKSLKKFSSLAQKDDSVISEYMENGGSIKEILSLIDATAKEDLTTALPVFEATHLILLRFQGEESHYHEHCIEAAKIILRSYIKTIQSLLGMNTAKHKKVALKLLTAIVTLHCSFANEVLNLFSPTSILTDSLIAPTPEKESVRKYFILFIMSFVVEGSSGVLKILLENKGFLSKLIPGLKFDEAEIVVTVLSLLENKILKSGKISKTLKLKTFNTQTVQSLFQLFDWKGLHGIKLHIVGQKKRLKHTEVNQEEKASVIDSVHSFLVVLCTSKKFGIAFTDKSLGTLETTSNNLLLTAFEGLSNPLDNEQMADVILKSLISCPDLVKPVLLKLEPFFEPRNSKNWFNAVQFAENLITGLDSVSLLKNNEELDTIGQISKVTKTLCTPLSLLRMIKSATGESQPMEVKMVSLKLLSTMWKETRKLILAFPQFEAELKKSVNDFVTKFLPEMEQIVELWRDVCDKEFLMSRLKKLSSFLSVLLDALQILSECRTESSRSIVGLASDLLNDFDRIKGKMGKNELVEVHVKLVRLVEKDLHSLTPDMDLFKTCFWICLQSNDESSVACTSMIFSNLAVFCNNKPEVDIWLSCYYTFPSENQQLVAKYLIESVSHSFNETYEKTVKKYSGVGDQNAETDSESPSQFINHCLQTLQNFHDETEKDSESIKHFQKYLIDVILYLQFSYPNSRFLLESVKTQKKILGKSIIKYLECWVGNSLSVANFDVFTCPKEKELAVCIFTRKCDVEIFNSDATALQLYKLFKMAIGFLVLKTVHGETDEKEVVVFVKILSPFFKTDESDEYVEKDSLISEKYKDLSAFRAKCVLEVLSNEFLLNSFDVFAKKSTSEAISSTIITEVLMKDEKRKRRAAKASANWRGKFLKGLSSKLKKGKTIEGVAHFKSVLDFFEYNHEDVAEIVDQLAKVSDNNLFLYDNRPSNWTLTFVKFVRLHCLKEELPKETVKKLCNLMKHFNDSCCSGVDLLDECFVFFIRQLPQHLLFIDNDFVKVLLKRKTSSEKTIILSKILLNDPAKVDHFLKIASSHSDSSLVYSMVGTLLASEDSFLATLIKFQSSCSVWKTEEISKESNRQLYKLLACLYEKREKDILETLMGAENSLIINNRRVTELLIKLFLEKNTLKGVKKDISKGAFNPELLYVAIKKVKCKKLTNLFLNGLITLFHRLLSNSKDVEDNLWVRYCNIVTDIVEDNEKTTWDGDGESSSEWKKFFKLALGLCFNTSKHPSLLKIIRVFITAFHNSEEQVEATAHYFQMIISHSQFLNVMLSKSPLKRELVDLYYFLVRRSATEMNTKHIPMLLASYTASVSSADEVTLKILKFYESKGFKLSDYEPLVWGEAAISHYSIGTGSGLFLWQRFTMANVLDLLDAQRMEMSLTEFPVNRSLEFHSNVPSEFAASVYDPSFLLPLFANLLSHGAVVFPLPFIYKGGLAYTIRAFSSECSDIRMMASTVLTRFYNHLELNQNLKQKLVWMHFINCFRFGIEKLSVKSIPNIITLFFARMTLELSQPPSGMHVPLQNYLLAKPYFVFNTVPEFLPLFHSSHTSAWQHREWLLKVLRDGTKVKADVKVLLYSMALKVILSFFQSPLSDNETKKIILQVMEKLLKAEKSMLFFSEYGLLSWLNSIDSTLYSSIITQLLQLLHTSADIIIDDVRVHKNKNTNFSHIIRILNICMKLLPCVKSVKSADAFNLYLQIIFNCLVLFANENVKNDWFLVNKTKLREITDIGINTLGYDCNKFCRVPFYFREYDDDAECENETRKNLKNAIFLFHKLSESE